MSNNKIYVDGRLFKSQMELASYLGVTPGSFYSMVKKLGSIDKAIDHYKSKLRSKSPIWVNDGVEYYSLASIAKFFKISPSSFSEYVSKHGFENAIVHCFSKSCPERYTVGDQHDLNLKEASVAAHVSRSTILKIAEETGNSIQCILDDAYSKWLKKGKAMYNGVTYFKVTDLCGAYGCPSYGGQRLVRNYNYTLQDVADLMSRFNSSIKRPVNMLTMCTALNHFNDREKAATFIERCSDSLNDSGSFRIPIVELLSWTATIDGVTYYTRSSIAEVLNLSEGNLYYHFPNQETRQADIERYAASQKHLISKLRKETELLGVVPAYKNGAFAVCPKCNKVLLLPLKAVYGYAHSNACLKYAVPQGMAVPKSLGYYIKGNAPYRFTLTGFLEHKRL